MSRLAFSTNAFKKNTLPEAIDQIAGIGYAGVELMADLHHAWPPTFDAPRRRDAKKQLAGRGVVVSNVNAFTCFVHGDTYHPTWIEPDPARIQIRIDHTIRSLELAAEFGARTVSIQPGGPMIGTGMSYGEGNERFAESLSRCVDAARKTGVILAVEPEPGLLIQTAGEYLDFKAKFFPDEPMVMMNCDCGHLFCVGDDPAAVIRQHHDQIAHVHLEDIGKNRVHQHLAPGKGVMDFGAIFEALKDVDYTGWTTVELYPYETTAGGVAEAAWKHLKPIADEFLPSNSQ
jgi:protein FrlC